MLFLLIVQVLVAVLLITVILMQRSKGTGIGTPLSGGVGESMFGVQAGNVLTRTTVVLTCIFLLDATLMAYCSSGRKGTSVVDKLPDAPRSAAARPSAPAGAQANSGAASAGAVQSQGIDQPTAAASPISADVPAQHDAGVPGPAAAMQPAAAPVAAPTTELPAATK